MECDGPVSNRNAWRYWQHPGLWLMVWVALLTLLSAQSEEWRWTVWQGLHLPVFPGVDKLQHLLFFAVFGMLVARCWLRLGGGAGSAQLVAGGLAAALVGVLDEWHQSFVPGRTVSALDWTADVLGALLGALLVVIWCALRRRYAG